jgi:hypothetical protein
MALIDWNGFLERLEHNQALALELTQDLLTAVSARAIKLSAAIDSKDQKLIEHSAHALRGLLSPYGPLELLSAIRALEDSAKDRTLIISEVPAEITAMIDVLKHEIRSELDVLLADLQRKNRPRHL